MGGGLRQQHADALRTTASTRCVDDMCRPQQRIGSSQLPAQNRTTVNYMLMLDRARVSIHGSTLIFLHQTRYTSTKKLNTYHAFDKFLLGEPVIVSQDGRTVAMMVFDFVLASFESTSLAMTVPVD